ncbi:MAG: hypothetical protein NVSMB51_14230 [Solirubrobacteraceae bacterium]
MASATQITRQNREPRRATCASCGALDGASGPVCLACGARSTALARAPLPRKAACQQWDELLAGQLARADRPTARAGAQSRPVRAATPRRARAPLAAGLAAIVVLAGAGAGVALVPWRADRSSALLTGNSITAALLQRAALVDRPADLVRLGGVARGQLDRLTAAQRSAATIAGTDQRRAAVALLDAERALAGHLAQLAALPAAGLAAPWRAIQPGLATDETRLAAASRAASTAGLDGSPALSAAAVLGPLSDRLAGQLQAADSTLRASRRALHRDLSLRGDAPSRAATLRGYMLVRRALLGGPGA